MFFNVLNKNHPYKGIFKFLTINYLQKYYTLKASKVDGTHIAPYDNFIYCKANKKIRYL
jgi:hypothetical protein